MKEVLRQLSERLIDMSGVILFFLLWEILPRLGVLDAQFIPPFSAVLQAIVKLLANGELFIHMAASLQRTLLGLLLALVLAIPAGFVLGGVFPTLSRHVRPLLRLLGQINAFSLFPIFILFFGIGEVAKVSIIFWSTIWPVLFTTIAGVQQIDPLYIKSARSVGAGRLTIFTRVLLPGAAPVIFTGIRTGASHAFLMLIAAEMIGASAGLGWIVHNSSMNFVIPRLFAATIIIALLGMAINYFIYWLEENLLEWKQ
ncbi:ABC transporter permease [Propionispora hippei]|uniref:NitT/TauT family transport system permease protein n=1 Tax=Propionispora hippei DSM 15287 TaxID=1123003 RepID=A0A1M6EBD6_9FIRM|nr:ABC transporter permease [Propionispora hippei]SHI82816.1 NitT/TauT family transport system permease protein [Propionispora hippei DSM 15287]